MRPMCHQSSTRTHDLLFTPESWQWLYRQRGDLAQFDDMHEWCDAYAHELQKTAYQIGFSPSHVIDIGAGLGAIDAYLIKASGAHCTLIDGEDGDGHPRRGHAVPFGSRRAVSQFMAENGIDASSYDYATPQTLRGPIADLVISTRSWCFHYAPEEYLGFVQQHTCAGTMIMVDMRTNKPTWRRTMQTAFQEMNVVEVGDKFERVQYKVRGMTQ